MREAVFNALGSLGVLEDARVLDLFAGTGAMGIEALSRGARRATFVEHARDVVPIIHTNLTVTDLEADADVVSCEASEFLASTAEHFDLVFVDPPYAFDAWPRLLVEIERVAPGGLVVIESDRAVEVPQTWSVVRERRYGSTLITITEIPTQPRERC